MGDLSNRIAQKLWSYCNVLRDDGLSYQDYLEQLTFILFLKLADERAGCSACVRVREIADLKARVR
jgi:type I restriction enzyme M protein